MKLGLLLYGSMEDHFVNMNYPFTLRWKEDEILSVSLDQVLKGLMLLFINIIKSIFRDKNKTTNYD